MGKLTQREVLKQRLLGQLLLRTVSIPSAGLDPSATTRQSAAFPPRSLIIDFLPGAETEPAEQSLDVQASASICQRRGTPFSDLTPPFINLSMKKPQEGLGHISSPSVSWLWALTTCLRLFWNALAIAPPSPDGTWAGTWFPPPEPRREKMS